MGEKWTCSDPTTGKRRSSCASCRDMEFVCLEIYPLSSGTGGFEIGGYATWATKWNLILEVAPGDVFSGFPQWSSHLLINPQPDV